MYLVAVTAEMFNKCLKIKYLNGGRKLDSRRHNEEMPALQKPGLAGKAAHRRATQMLQIGFFWARLHGTVSIASGCI